MRELADWADLKYRSGGHVSHVVPFGNPVSLCGIDDSDERIEWYGTGTFDEIERAQKIPVCFLCQDALPKPQRDPAVEVWETALRETGDLKTT